MSDLDRSFDHLSLGAAHQRSSTGSLGPNSAGAFDAGDAANDTGYGAGRSLFSSRLAFLAGYRDFHRLYAEGQLRAAAELLVVLLTSNAAPERFWAVLLVDAIPLLEGASNAAGVA